MYYVKKRMECAVAHNLTLDYESKCQNIHGHNLIITVYMKASKLDRNGMVMDFKHIKNEIHEKLDHRYLNEVLPSGMNPTAENLARWVLVTLNRLEFDNDAECYRVDVQESEGNTATYTTQEEII